MARGYPDFYGSFIHPQGGIVGDESCEIGVIAAGVTQQIFNLSNRGSSYGGWISFDLALWVPANFYLDVHLDGDHLYNMDAVTEMKHSYHTMPDQFVNLIEYDEINKQISYVFGKDWTWGSSCILVFENLTGGNVTPGGRFYWSRIAGA